MAQGQQGTALARREAGDEIQIQGTYSRPADIMSRLEMASARAHLVTPASACSSPQSSAKRLDLPLPFAPTTPTRQPG